MKYTHILGAVAIMTSVSVMADPFKADSGLVTVFPGQTAKLNALNLGSPDLSCSFTLKLIDNTGAGSTLAELLQSPGLPGGGQSVSLSFPPQNAPLSAPTQVRAQIDFTQQLNDNTSSIDPMIGCYNIIPTLEIITDNVATDVLNTTFYGLPSLKAGEKIEKVKICHKPNSPAEKTLWVPLSAVKGHVVHGDKINVDCSDL